MINEQDHIFYHEGYIFANIPADIVLIVPKILAI